MASYHRDKISIRKNRLIINRNKITAIIFLTDIDYRKIPHTFKYYRQCLMVADFISQDEKVCRYPRGLPLVALLFVRRLLAEPMVKMNRTRA